MSPLEAFCKAAPETFVPRASAACRAEHRYFLEGEGRVYGVLFEGTTAVFAEWLGEAGRLVRQPAEARYVAWPKHVLAERLVRGGWQIDADAPQLAPPALPRSLRELHAAG
jgi:hypothetical protein